MRVVFAAFALIASFLGSTGCQSAIVLPSPGGNSAETPSLLARTGALPTAASAPAAAALSAAAAPAAPPVAVQPPAPARAAPPAPANAAPPAAIAAAAGGAAPPAG